MAISEIDLIVVPYDSGHEDRRMGAGPRALVGAGAPCALEESGARVRVLECHPEDDWRAELRTGFDLQRRVAVSAAAAHARGVAPVLMSGNCNTMLGMVAAAGCEDDLGVVWMDAHGDGNLPDRDGSGFLDGHGLAMLTGRAWQAATAQIPGFRPLCGQQVLLVGARDFNPGEAQATRATGVTIVPVEAMSDEQACQRAATSWSPERLHVHVDLDVLDLSVGRANTYAVAGGMTTAQVCAFISAATRKSRLVSASVASYDPAIDDGSIAAAAMEILRTIGGRLKP